VVEDGEVLSLGDRSLRFIHTPWVHWPETMSAYLAEEKMLFSCDFMGSHLQAPRCLPERTPRFGSCQALLRGDHDALQADDQRQYGEGTQAGNRDHRSQPWPLWDFPEIIMSAYEDWISDTVGNKVVIPFISMHGSTAKMVDFLTPSLPTARWKCISLTSP
jgi:flavorubredoxin